MATDPNSIIYVGNTTTVRISGIKYSGGSYINNATVSLVSLTDLGSGASVSGITYPVSMEYVSDSDGSYEATLPYSLEIENGRRYTAVVRADTPSGERAEWEERLKATIRRE